jgi:Cd(II)/Pb(II)-responsive transcriptional regulator
MRIGKLARSAGCQVETVRYYEQEQLLPEPPRTAAGYRSYDPQHLEQLRFILHCRSLDMSLADIRVLQGIHAHPEMTCDVVNEMLDKRIEEVRERIATLGELQQQLEALRSTCRTEKAVNECGILKTLVTAATGEECICHGKQDQTDA